MVYQKIVDWRDTLAFPSDIPLSPEAKDLIQKLLQDESCRLGKNGAKEIKAHPFFQSIKWSSLRESPTYFTPSLKNKYDTQYFPKQEEDEPWYIPENNNSHLVTFKECNYDQYIFRDFEVNFVLERQIGILNQKFLEKIEGSKDVQEILKVKN